MKIVVTGLWHLGTVYAACLAAGGHTVVGIDDESRVSELSEGHLPVSEPGLKELMAQQRATGRLVFSSNMQAFANAEIVWVCYDTPVSPDGLGDADFVIAKIEALLPSVSPNTLILISSQLPAGTVSQLQTRCEAVCREKSISFGYSPENLRLGTSIDYFLHPDRFVVGVQLEDRDRVAEALAPFTSHIVWMSPVSAEMVKHALNSYFATSIAFINEIAALCEGVGADAMEVERGLKSDKRIGEKAYLHPGSAFAGGTLVRDLTFLLDQASRQNITPYLLEGVQQSNQYHKNWTRRKTLEVLGNLTGKCIAVLGLTYKPGTNTLRGSDSMDFCSWASTLGVRVQAFDPEISELPESANGNIVLCQSATQALLGADVAVISTPWPAFKSCALKISLLL